MRKSIITTAFVGAAILGPVATASAESTSPSPSTSVSTSTAATTNTDNDHGSDKTGLWGLLGLGGLLGLIPRNKKVVQRVEERHTTPTTHARRVDTDHNNGVRVDDRHDTVRSNDGIRVEDRNIDNNGRNDIR